MDIYSKFFPPDFPTRAASALGIEAWRIPIVIASAIGIYVIFLVLVRLFGVRILGSLSSFDAVVIIMFGAVAGRVIIGHPPTVAAGGIGLATLMAMEAVFGAAQHLRGVSRTLAAPPVVVLLTALPNGRAASRTYLHTESPLRDSRCGNCSPPECSGDHPRTHGIAIGHSCWGENTGSSTVSRGRTFA